MSENITLDEVKSMQGSRSPEPIIVKNGETTVIGTVVKYAPASQELFLMLGDKENTFFAKRIGIKVDENTSFQRTTREIAEQHNAEIISLFKTVDKLTPISHTDVLELASHAQPHLKEIQAYIAQYIHNHIFKVILEGAHYPISDDVKNNILIDIYTAINKQIIKGFIKTPIQVIADNKIVGHCVKITFTLLQYAEYQSFLGEILQKEEYKDLDIDPILYVHHNYSSSMSLDLSKNKKEFTMNISSKSDGAYDVLYTGSIEDFSKQETKNNEALLSIISANVNKPGLELPPNLQYLID